jgi:hypothetical protein
VNNASLCFHDLRILQSCTLPVNTCLCTAQKAASDAQNHLHGYGIDEEFVQFLSSHRNKKTNSEERKL